LDDAIGRAKRLFLGILLGNKEIRNMRLESVGKYKIDYKDHEDISFESLSDYITLAKKIIAKNAKWLLKDEDAISSVAHCIMMADWRYDENNNLGKDRPNKTLYSYRNQCGIWGIKTYLTKKSKKVFPTCSLDYQNQISGNNVHNIIQDKKSRTPLEELENEECSENTRTFIDKILNSDEISKKQQEFIKLYYLENYTYERIAKLHGLRRESVRQSIIRALKVLKENYVNES
jgi:RNA polymerase sigma factor (sigma-70 family)